MVEPTRAYQRVYAQLKEQIQQGEFPVGSRLPPERLLATRLGVSRNTLRQALRLLREEGLVEPAQGSGVYVRGQGESPPRVKTIAVLLADLLTPLHQHFVHTLTMKGQEKGLVTTIALHRDSDGEAVNALTGLLHLCPDIVVVEPTRNLALPLLDQLNSRDIPRILVIRDHPDLLCDKVVVNNFQVGNIATQLLIQYGCRAPIFVAPLDYLTAWDRLAGYRHALLDAGLPFRSENVLDASRGPLPPPDFGAQLVDDLVAAGSRFDAVVAFNDTFARKIIDRLQQRGLRVPDDVAVVGVDDLPCALEGEVPITTITFDGAGAARQILELIGERLTAGDRYPTKGTIGLRVVPRASCPVANTAEVAAAASASGPLIERKDSPFSKLLLLFWVAWVILLWSFPAPAARVIIRHSHDGEHGPAWQEWLRQAKERFEQENPDIEILLEFQSRAAQDEKLLLTYGTDLFPDVVEVFAAHHFKFMAAGMFSDLNRFVQADPDLSWDQFPPHVLGGSTIGEGLPGEGQTWMIPVSIWVNGPTFNDDHFAESALVPPSQMEDQWTWDDFVEIGRKLVRYDSSGQVIRWAYRPGDWKVWVHNAGGWMFDRYVDPTQVTLHTEPVRTALRFLQDVYQTEGLVNPNTDLVRGDVSVWIQTGPNVTRILQNAGATFNWSYGPNPKLVRGGAELVVIGLAMSSRTEHPQEAWRWIKFLVKDFAAEHIAITGRPAAFGPVAQEYAGLIPDATEWEHVWVELITRPDSYDRPVVHTDVMNALNQVVQEILEGEQPVETALDGAQERISALLQAHRFYRQE